MKKNVMIGIVFLVYLSIFVITVHADNGQLYRVNSATVELRDQPDQNAIVIAELQRGERVTVFGESDGWGKTYYDGKEVWVAIHQLTAVGDAQMEQKEAEPGESADDGQLYQVKTTAVNVRNAPDKNADILTELNNGEKVTVFGESNGWGKTFYNEKEAWIALQPLIETNESTDNMALETNDTNDSQQTTEKTANESDQKSKDDEKEASAAENEEEKKSHSGEKVLSGYHVVIDPGHGGKDTGAIGSEVYEKTLTLSTAKEVENQLRDKGASVTLTRTDDTFIPLEERAQISNSEDTDAFISLHYNASEDPSARGIHTFYSDDHKDRELAVSIQKSLIDHVNLADRGAKQADFEVLRDNQQLALLIEFGFISNPEEQKLVQTDEYQEKAAKGISAGLENYFK